MKLTNFGSRYLIEGVSERDEIDREGLGTSSPRLVNFGAWGPPGRQNTEGCKNCNAFLVHRLTERDEIWHMVRGLAK